MNIALVAHDARKPELLDWVKYNYKELSKHKLFATGTTGKLIGKIYIGEAKSGHIDDGEWNMIIRMLNFLSRTSRHSCQDR